jgi:hypothetical protein
MGKGNLNMRFLIIFSIFFVLAVYAQATLEISVATDKTAYQIGENVDIFISVFNSGSTSEKLYGGFYFTTYIMDGVYDWADRYQPMVILTITFLPGETRTWEMTHGFDEMQAYPLNIGNHSVVGGAGSLRSIPVEFQVVPEPATLSLLALGVFLLGRKKK